MLLLRLVLSRYQPLAPFQTKYNRGRVRIHKFPEATSSGKSSCDDAKLGRRQERLSRYFQRSNCFIGSVTGRSNWEPKAGNNKHVVATHAVLICSNIE